MYIHFYVKVNIRRKKGNARQIWRAFLTYMYTVSKWKFRFTQQILYEKNFLPLWDLFLHDGFIE